MLSCGNWEKKGGEFLKQSVRFEVGHGRRTKF